MLRDCTSLQGIVTSFDELMGKGIVKLKTSSEQFNFTSNDLRGEITQGDDVLFEVHSQNGGALLATKVQKV